MLFYLIDVLTKLLPQPFTIFNRRQRCGGFPFKEIIEIALSEFREEQSRQLAESCPV